MKWNTLAIIGVCLFSATKAATRTFPPNFMFGAATASYQVEGAWDVNGKGENIWDRLTHTTNLVQDGSSGDIACNSYYNVKRDVEMLVELGVDFYRFSLSWSRILPTGFTNNVNADGIRYYNELIDELIANGITPMITLYHWDLPQPIQQLGGWTTSVTADYFADYADIVFAAFGDRVKYWLTLNEPLVCCFLGYGIMAMAPAANMSGIGDYLCSTTMLMGHANVYHLYQDKYKVSQGGKVGLTLNANWIEPGDSSAETIQAAEDGLQFELGWFANPIFSRNGDYPAVMKANIARKSREQGFKYSRLPEFSPAQVEYIKGTADFFGLNHYTTSLAKRRTDENWQASPSYEDDIDVIKYADESWPGSASDWLNVVPWGFTKLINWIRTTYDNPELIVFENGFSDRGGLQDSDRVNYYHQYINAMLDAIEQGSNVTGYTAWSLMDNFEWLAGYTERFGIYEVDFNSPERTRTPKDSARYYAEILRTRTIESVTKDVKFESKT